MIFKTIDYTQYDRVNLQTYIPDYTGGDLRPAILVCPGGA